MKQKRNTRQKQTILEAALARGDHPSADQLYLELRSAGESVSRGTVFRNLSQLAQAGLLTHVKVPSADRFDGRLDKHYHLFCVHCGAVCDAPLAYQAENDQTVAEATGFQIERHRMIFEGLCPECQGKANK